MDAVAQLHKQTPEIPEYIVEKFARDQRVTLDEAKRQFGEVRKFLAVCAADRYRGFAPSAVIDQAWHAFVLHTGTYASFCDRFLGGFVHHRPTSQPEHEAYARTLQVLKANFGTLDGRYWPAGKAADCDSGSCENYCSDGTCEAAFIPRPASD